MLKFLQLLTIGNHMTPETRQILRETIDRLTAEALKTPGSADDQAMTILRTIAMIVGIY